MRNNKLTNLRTGIFSPKYNRDRTNKKKTSKNILSNQIKTLKKCNKRQFKLYEKNTMKR